MFKRFMWVLKHPLVQGAFLTAAVCAVPLVLGIPSHRAPVPLAPKPYWLVVTPDDVAAATFNPSATICTPGWSIPSGVQFRVVVMPSKFDDPCNPKSWANPPYGVRIAEGAK